MLGMYPELLLIMMCKYQQADPMPFQEPYSDVHSVPTPNPDWRLKTHPCDRMWQSLYRQPARGSHEHQTHS